MNPKVSVIVPAYNAEKFLARCLNSIAVQTMPDFECIIVDDGSTDRTGEIAESFAKKDPRFRVVHQENGGVAVARQTGLDESCGIYTIQFDSDDWVETNILEELINVAEANDADMVICDVEVISQGESVVWHQRPEAFDTNVVLGNMMQQLCCGFWNKLIKKNCYEMSNIRIPSGEYSEDLYVCLCLLSNPIKVRYVPKALYHWDMEINKGSLTKNMRIPLARLNALELYAENRDISCVQKYYDSAILKNAYDMIFVQNGNLNFYKLYRKHLPSIRRAEGYPLRVKLLVLLRIYGIRVPIQKIKQIWRKILQTE